MAGPYRAFATATPVLVDTHAHLYLDRFSADIDSVIANAAKAGVAQILQPAVDLPSIDAAIALCERSPGLYAMAAIHPTYVPDAPDDAADRVREALQHDAVIAVGETGLDYYWSLDHVDAQQASLRQHARLALELDLPIVLHNRDKQGRDGSSRDLVRILTEEAGGASYRGVFHCFGGPTWLAEEALGLGFHLGLGGTLTFKNAGVPAAIDAVPLDRIVLETDAPYLAPVPHRGARNEPAYVAYVAEALADLRGLSVDAVGQATTANARALFRLPDVPVLARPAT